MLNNITIGQYFPGDSVLHRLDPRSKIAILFFLIVAIFVFDQPTAYGVLTFLTLACMVASGVPMKTQVGSLKPLWWIILFTFLIHLFSGAGDELFHMWILTATWDGLVRGCFICLRLALLLLLSSLLTFTTSPLKLTDALEAILSPLKAVGVPAHELAMMMTIALRFVPTLIEETDKIMKAQQSRGADF
ncbi:energy-coupling factor transporter transmembrane component T, partial [Selenomonas sp.]|uniref:energy-coupling factor transporter transmembrane component T family protein n=1 Tax=Selenomonas sp. TaxID=2053611 RepID=UPI002A82198A